MHFVMMPIDCRWQCVSLSIKSIRDRMSNETFPLQFDMFSQDYVDNRTRDQKRKDRERQKLQQGSLFSIHEMVQLTASARPWLNQMPQPPLALEIQEARTEEEIERDRRREAEALTATMFGDSLDMPASLEPEEELTPDRPQGGNTVALFLVNKESMVAARPDLKAQIDGLSEVELQAISQQIEEVLRPVYGLLLNAALMTVCAQKALVEKVGKPEPDASIATANSQFTSQELDESPFAPIFLPNISDMLPMTY